MNDVVSKKVTAGEVLIHPEPQSCTTCGVPTYFAIVKSFFIQAQCPNHLAPRMHKRSYAALLRSLNEAIYLYESHKLFAPQQAYWETLSDEQQWEQVGRGVHKVAMEATYKAVAAMAYPETQ